MHDQAGGALSRRTLARKPSASHSRPGATAARARSSTRLVVEPLDRSIHGARTNCVGTDRHHARRLLEQPASLRLVAHDELDADLAHAAREHAHGRDLRVVDVDDVTAERAQLGRAQRRLLDDARRARGARRSTESPIANQPSNCMKTPLRMSIRKRWSAKPSSSTSSEAPAIAPLPPHAGDLGDREQRREDVGDVADARLDESDGGLVALERHDHTGGRTARDRGACARSDPTSRSATRCETRETTHASTNAIATKATMRHGSGRKCSWSDPHAAGYRLAPPVARERGVRGLRAAARAWEAALDRRADRGSCSRRTHRPAEHDRDDHGDLEREHEEPAEQNASSRRMRSRASIRSLSPGAYGTTAP